MSIPKFGSWLALAAGIPLLVSSGCAEEDPEKTVRVDLEEWAISLDRNEVSEGPVTFVVRNHGEDLHEVVVLFTDLTVEELPVVDGEVVEDAPGIEELGEIEDIEPGGTGELTLDLEAGHYLLICNLTEEEPDGEVENHFPLGMAAELTVTSGS